MKISKGILPFCSYLTKKFYSFNLHQLINNYQKGQIFSIFLILSKGVIILILLLFNNDYVYVAEEDANLEFLKKEDYFHQWQSNDYAPLIQLASLVLNLINILYILVSYFIFIYKGYFQFILPAESRSLQDLKHIQVDEEAFLLEMSKVMQSKLYEVMSMYFSLYHFLLQAPIVYFSVMQIRYPLAPINFLLSLLIGTLILDSDFNYSNESRDCMKRPYTKYNTLVFYFDIIAIILVSEWNWKTDTLTIGIYFWLNGLFSSFVCPYYEYQTRFWNIFSYFYSGSLSLTFFFFIEKGAKLTAPSSLMILVYIPLFYKLASFFCDLQDKQTYDLFIDIFRESGTVQLNKVDRFIRLDFFKQLQNFSVKDQNLIDIYSNVIQRAICVQQNSKMDYSAENQSLFEKIVEQIENGESIELSVLLFLKRSINRISSRFNDASVSVIYLVYLLEIVNCKRSYLLEYNRIRMQKLTIKEEQIFFSIHLRFLKQKDILQKTQGFKNPFDSVYQSVLEFEDRTLILLQFYDRAVQKKVQLLAYLRQKQLDVEELLTQVTELREMQTKIRIELNNLIKINRLDPKLISLSFSYIEAISFSEKDLLICPNLNSMSSDCRAFSNPLFNSQRQIISKKRYQQNEDFSEENGDSIFGQEMIYNKNCCVLFTVIDKSTNLIIKRTSSNASHIFGVSQKELVDKRIEVLMPSNYSFVKNHREYINHYLENSNIIENSMKKKMLFGESAKGYLIPIYIDTRLIYQIDTDEIGFSAIMYEISDSSDYLLFNSHTFSYIGSTKNLINTIFPSKKLTKNTDVSLLFPFIQYKYQKKQLNFLKQQTLLEDKPLSQKYTNLQSDQPKSSNKHHINNYNNNVNSNIINENANKNIIFNNNFNNTDRCINNQCISNENNFKNEQKYNNNFEYLFVIESKNKEELSQESKTTYQFFLMEISINNANYRNIDNLSYLKIQKIRHLSIAQNGYSILKYLNDDKQLYSLIFSSHTLENIIESIDIEIFKNDIQQHPVGKSYFLNQPQPQKELCHLSIKNSITQSNGLMRNDGMFENTQLQKIKHSPIEKINEEKNSDSSKSVSENMKLQEEEIENQTTIPYALSPRDHQSYDIFESNREFLVSKEEQLTQNQRLSIFQSQIIGSQSNRQEYHNEQQQQNERRQSYGIQLKLVESRVSLTASTQNFSPLCSGSQLYRNTIKGIDNNYIQNLLQQEQAGKEATLQKKLKQTMECARTLSQNMEIMSFQNMTQQKYFQNIEDVETTLKQKRQSQLTTAAGVKNESKKRLKQKGLHQDHQQQQLEEGSSISRDSSSTTTQKQLISIIRSPVNINLFKLINLIGIITFLILFSVTFQQFLTLNTNTSTISDNLTVQNWPYEVPNVLNRLIKNINILSLERRNNFIFGSGADQSNLDTYLISLIKNSSDSYLSLLNFMETLPNGQMLFNKISQDPSNFSLNILYDPNNLTKQSSVRTTLYYQTIHSSLQYTIVFISQYLYRSTLRPTSTNIEGYILQNIPSIVSGLTATQSYFSDYQDYQSDQMKNELSNQITIILTLSAACLIVILPLYSFIQHKKDVFISLFCTFPTNQLQAMILKIKTTYYQNKTLLPYIKNIPLEIQALSNNFDSSKIKKQTMSTISKLPRFKIAYLVLLVIVFSLLSISPILNSVYVQEYLRIQNNNISMLHELNYVKSFIVESSAMSAFGLMMKIYPDSKGTPLSQFINQIQASLDKLNTAIDQLNQASNQVSFTGRLNQNAFDTFFFPMFENDICSLLENNPQYILDLTKFSPDFCRTIYNGFFQKGLKVCMNYYTQILKDLDMILNIQDPVILDYSIQELFKSLDLKNYNYMIDYLDEILSIMKSFLIDNSQSSYQNLQTFQTFIIIFQISLLVLTFGVGWFLFSQYMIQQVSQTKHLLQVINVYQLLDNYYILTFVKNHSKF